MAAGFFIESLFIESPFMEPLFIESLFMEPLFIESLFMEPLFIVWLFIESLFIESLFIEWSFIIDDGVGVESASAAADMLIHMPMAQIRRNKAGYSKIGRGVKTSRS